MLTTIADIVGFFSFLAIATLLSGMVQRPAAVARRPSGHALHLRLISPSYWESGFL